MLSYNLAFSIWTPVRGQIWPDLWFFTSLCRRGQPSTVIQTLGTTDDGGARNAAMGLKRRSATPRGLVRSSQESGLSEYGPFARRSILSEKSSKNQMPDSIFVNRRDTAISGRHRRIFRRPVGVFNAPIPEIKSRLPWQFSVIRIACAYGSISNAG